MRRFVFLIAWQSDGDGAPRGIVKWALVGLAIVGVAAVILWRVVGVAI